MQVSEVCEMKHLEKILEKELDSDKEYLVNINTDANHVAADEEHDHRDEQHGHLPVPALPAGDSEVPVGGVPDGLPHHEVHD